MTQLNYLWALSVVGTLLLLIGSSKEVITPPKHVFDMTAEKPPSHWFPKGSTVRYFPANVERARQ